jgi:gamma-glutamylputrescine oxidase
MFSYWEYESFIKNIEYAIVGSGIVGLNAAIYLKEQDPSNRVAIIERSFLPYGASTRNAGFACFGSLTELIDDLANTSENEVFTLVEKRYRGLERLRKRVGDAALRYEEWGGMEIFKTEEKDIAAQCLDAMPYFNEKIGKLLGKKEIYSRLSNNEVKQYGFAGISTIIKNTAEGQIHTGEMMRHLLAKAQALGVLFLNGLDIRSIEEEGGTVVLHSVEGWQFSVAKLLVCTNGFARRLMPTLQVQAARNQVVVTAPIPNLALRGCFHYDRGYFYFRNIDDRILLGGGRNLSYQEEQTDSFGTTPIIQEALQQLLQEVILPQQTVKIEHKWSGILGLGPVKKPIIEKISPHIGVAVRMGGMGVAIGTLVGEEGAALLLDNK